MVWLHAKGPLVNIAILDDYQNVPLTIADWSAVESRADIKSSLTTSPTTTR